MRLRALLARSNVVPIGPSGHWERLEQMAVAGQATGSLLMDAHAATLAAEHGATLATTDRDFRRFDGLRRLLDPFE